MSEINLKLDKLKEIDAQLAAMPPAPTLGSAPGGGRGAKDASSSSALVKFSAPFSLKPEEQPEMREV